MKCTEVTEWMHRYLDHDLSPAETEDMFRHLETCPACADLFERLASLSEQLENLPDVQPPFSLVDSILPRLEALDREAEAQEQSARMEPAPAAAVESGAMPGRSRRSNRRGGSSMAMRTGIGAVAAAVMLGIAILNMPEDMPDAQVEDHLSSSANTGTTLSGQNAAGGNAEQNANALDGGASDGAADGAADSGLTENSTAPGDAANSGPAGDSPVSVAVPPSPSPDQADQDAGAAPEGNARKADQADAPSGDAARKKQPEASTAPRTDAKKKPPEGGSGTGAASQPPEALKKSADAQPASPEAAPSGDPAAGAPERALIAPSEDPMMSYMELRTVEQWDSADGKYTAVKEGEQLTIYTAGADGGGTPGTAVVSIPLEGSLVSVEWSADGKQLKYVTDSGGTLKEQAYRVDEHAGTERAAEPSAAPKTSPQASPSGTPAPRTSPQNSGGATVSPSPAGTDSQAAPSAAASPETPAE